MLPAIAAATVNPNQIYRRAGNVITLFTVTSFPSL